MEEPSAPSLEHPLQHRPAVWGMRTLIGVVVAHGALAAAVFDRLPDRIPVHFGADGLPDGFAGSGLGSWFGTVLISAGFATVFALLSMALFRIPPKWLSLPKKEAFLALPEADRRAVLAAVAAHTLFLGATVCLGLLAIHAVVALAAFGALQRFPIALPFVIMGAIFAEAIVLFIRVSVAVERATARRVQRRR